ncbi:MAG: SDR family oxidoreductase [Pyrinomonadaceae bacterium]
MAKKEKKASRGRSDKTKKADGGGKLKKIVLREQADVSTEEHPLSPMPAQTQNRPGIEAKMSPRPEFLALDYRGSGKLHDKAALITGGDSGIGRAVAVLFAREGANVAIVYLKAEQRDAEETAAQIEREGRRALLIPGDVKDSKFCQKSVGQTVREFGKLDILINNAAFQKHQDKFEDITFSQWDKTFKTNIYGYFNMVKASLKYLKKGGVIINCGSITGLEGSKELIDYSSTKGAIHAFTKSLAQNLVEREIRVNAVAPGPVWTPLNIADKSAREAAKHGADTPMKRPAQPEEIAPAFVFFASNTDSSYISGEVLTILGGETRAS